MYIHQCKIIGTNCVIYSAWVESAIMNKHSTLRHLNGVWHGQVGTLTHSEQEYQEAYNAILAEHPECAEGARDMGEITIYVK